MQNLKDRKNLINFLVFNNIIALSFFYSTRLAGRFAPIFSFNCEHFHFVHIVKQKK